MYERNNRAIVAFLTTALSIGITVSTLFGDTKGDGMKAFMVSICVISLGKVISGIDQISNAEMIFMMILNAVGMTLAVLSIIISFGYILSEESINHKTFFVTGQVAITGYYVFVDGVSWVIEVAQWVLMKRALKKQLRTEIF